MKIEDPACLNQDLVQQNKQLFFQNDDCIETEWKAVKKTFFKR